MRGIVGGIFGDDALLKVGLLKILGLRRNVNGLRQGKEVCPQIPHSLRSAL
jgi:hypothetical protein